MSGGAASGASSAASALSGLGGSLEDKDCDLLCPVCFEHIDEAYVTRCGHSFCYACIAKSVKLHRRCPKCGAALAGRDHYFPNILINELVARRRLRSRPHVVSGSVATSPGPDAERLRVLMSSEARYLALPDVKGMLDVLTRRKRLLEAEADVVHHTLLHKFLAQLLKNRTHQLKQLSREAALVKKDMEHVAGVLQDQQRAGATEQGRLPSPSEPPLLSGYVRNVRPRLGKLEETASRSTPAEEEESFASTGGGTGKALAGRWNRLTPTYFDDLVQCYFAHRTDELDFSGSNSATPGPPGPSPAPPAGPARGVALADSVLQQASAAKTKASSAAGDQCAPEGDPPPSNASSASVPAASAAPVSGGGAEGFRGLDGFRKDLAALTRYRALRPIARLSYCNDTINYFCSKFIVSTIEFDKDDEFFTIADVTKRIKVFKFEAVVRDEEVHYPCAEMQCSHMISCASWNAYHKNVLASSDYEGTVSVWDASAGVRTRSLQEHDKRCWSVHFNRADVRLLASGSDDARVKLWSLNAERSVATLETKFKVHCVRFNPHSSCHLAVGSADHCVHYYDLRAPRAPLAVFRGHRKAVTYVKFVDARTLVSASTDSQLKLWNVESPRCLRSFTGHANERYFVGLATDGRYVACGSENNSLYVYYMGLSRPLMAYRFLGFLKKNFVSAVCWRRAADRPALLAANSQGTIKVLELV